MHELIKYSGKVFGFLDYITAETFSIIFYFMCVGVFFVVCVVITSIYYTHFTFELKLPHNMFNESISKCMEKVLHSLVKCE